MGGKWKRKHTNLDGIEEVVVDAQRVHVARALQQAHSCLQGLGVECAAALLKFGIFAPHRVPFAFVQWPASKLHVEYFNIEYLKKNLVEKHTHRAN